MQQGILRCTRLAAALALAGVGLPPAGAAETAGEVELTQIGVHGEQDDFDMRRDSSSTRLVYGREELDRMNELTVGDYLRRLPGVLSPARPAAPRMCACVTWTTRRS